MEPVVTERLVVRREGHLLQSRTAEGLWHDEYLYALRRDEWPARHTLTAAE